MAGKNKPRKRDQGREERILSMRLGMSMEAYRKLMGSSGGTAPNRVGMDLEEFRKVLTRSTQRQAEQLHQEEQTVSDVWTGKHFSYFSNHKCEYYPCHPGADPENFNCLFCYCPLYMLGAECGGQFEYLPNGYKDCTNCLYPHQAENYNAITGRYAEILARMAETE